MVGFVGREQELDALEQLYRKDGNSFVVVYGRRRVGKTAVLQQFCKGKENAFMYTCLRTTPEQNLKGLSTVVLRDVSGGFNSLDALLRHLGMVSQTQKTVLVIDEYPYYAAVDPSASSILQVALDTYLRDSHLMLILCGSSMSFMEQDVLGYKSPLYGRRDMQLKILPFRFADIHRFFPMAAKTDLAYLYGLTGGIPEYMKRIDADEAFSRIVCREVLSPTGRLYEEPINALETEFHEPKNYFAIVQTIAEGASRLQKIADKNHLDSALVVNYLSKLVELGFVEKEEPVGTTSGRKTIYRIMDPLLRFWFRFVAPVSSLLTQLSADRVYAHFIEPYLDQYMGQVFEQIAKEHILGLSLSFVPVRIGRWWGSDPRTRRQEEIDVVATDGRQWLFGECKWTQRPVTMQVLDALRYRSSLVAPEKVSKQYWLFSRNGFDRELLEAKFPDVTLVSLEDLG